MTSSSSPPSDAKQKQPLSPEEKLEAKKILIAVFLAVFPLIMTAVLMTFAGSAPGRTLDEGGYAIQPFLATLAILLIVGSLAFLWNYLGEYAWLACFSILSMIPMLISQGEAIDAWNRLDDSAPQIRRVTVMNQTHQNYETKRYGRGTTYTLELTNWREGEENLRLSSSRFTSDLPKGSQACIEERPGRLGRSWITDPRPCGPNE